jgi:hypothetical protein
MVRLLRVRLINVNATNSLLGQFVQFLGVDSFLKEPDSFGESGSEDAGGVKSGTVSDHDDDLALAKADVDGFGGNFGTEKEQTNLGKVRLG